MKALPFFLLVFLQGGSLVSASQQKDNTKVIEEADSTIEPFEQVRYYAKNKIPFRNIVVVDKRFDTTKIGYINSNTRICLGRSWTTILNEYFRENFEPSSGKTLFVFIKSYWLQKGIVDKITRKKVVLKNAVGSSPVNVGGTNVNPDKTGSCSVNLEVFMQSDSNFIPLFRIDDFFLNPLSNFRKNKLDAFFFLPYDSIARRLSFTNINSLQQQKKRSWNELTKYYDGRFDLPVCTEQPVRKGVFLTFDDFRKNKPLETEFRLKEGSKTDELYMGNIKNEQLVTDYWGYCDGSSLYIKAGFNVFKAVKQQKTFEIYGAKYINNYHNDPLQGDLLKINNTGIERKILQLNMDNGEFY